MDDDDKDQAIRSELEALRRRATVAQMHLDAQADVLRAMAFVLRGKPLFAQALKTFRDARTAVLQDGDHDIDAGLVAEYDRHLQSLLPGEVKAQTQGEDSEGDRPTAA